MITALIFLTINLLVDCCTSPSIPGFGSDELRYAEAIGMTAADSTSRLRARGPAGIASAAQAKPRRRQFAHELPQRQGNDWRDSGRSGDSRRGHGSGGRPARSDHRSVAGKFAEPFFVDGNPTTRSAATTSGGISSAACSTAAGRRWPRLSGRTLIAAVIGSLLGAIAGFRGGLIDTVIMRLVDLQLSIPFILLAMICLRSSVPGFGACSSRLPSRSGSTTPDSCAARR